MQDRTLWKTIFIARRFERHFGLARRAAIVQAVKYLGKP